MAILFIRGKERKKKTQFVYLRLCQHYLELSVRAISVV